MTQEKINSIREAIDLIEQAMCLVDEAVSDSPSKREYESYGRYGFDQLLGNGNPYDNSLFTLIDEIEKEEYCESCGSRVESSGNTYCDSCNDEYEAAADDLVPCFDSKGNEK